MRFSEALASGRAGEQTISRWLRMHGYSVLPAYEKLLDTGKGPQLYLPEGALIAPDLLVFKGERVLWIEAKHKTAFSWHRLTQRWVTGIDLKHYFDYLWVDDVTPWPVWLLFLHDGGQAKDSPPNSPAGLFGQTLAFLRENENHRSENWGRTGMVYWAVDKLRLMASREAVEKATREAVAVV